MVSRPDANSLAPADTSDAELLRQFVRSRDDLAFGRIVARHARAVRRVAYGYVHDAHAAEDVAQAAFLVLARRPRPALRSARRRRTLLPWLAKVARYASANWYRADRLRQKREREGARRETAYDPTAGHDLADAVRSAMRRLPRRDRRIVELRHLSQLSWDDVARHAGTTPDAARVAGSRALSQLRIVLEQRGVTAGGAALLAGLSALAAPTSARAATVSSAAATAPELALKVLFLMKLKSALSAAAVAAAAIGLAATAYALAPDADVPPATASPDRTGNPLVADLGEGGSLEVLYLAEHKAGGRVWRPDGTPMPGGRGFEMAGFAEGDGWVEIAMRHRSPAGPSYLTYSFSPGAESVAEVASWRNERGSDAGSADARRAMRDRGIVLALVRPADGAKTVALEAIAPLGGWQPLHRWAPGGFGDRSGDSTNFDESRPPAVSGTYADDHVDGDGRPWIDVYWSAAGFRSWQTQARASLRDGRLVTMTSDDRSADDNLIGRSSLAGHERREVAFFELIGRPYGEVLLTGLAAAPEVEADPQARRDPTPVRPDAEPADHEAPVVQADLELRFPPRSLIDFALQVGRECEVPIQVASYVLDAVGIDAWRGDGQIEFEAEPGEPLDVAMRRSVKAVDERLTVIWRDGRYLITLEDDLTPPPPAPEPPAE